MKVGIIATSPIVPWFIEATKPFESVKILAISSRNADKAKPYAEQFQIPKIYTDIEDMCKDPDIDTIYLTSPNFLHYSQTKMALSYGKNVINEKPFAATLAQAKELYELAEKNHVFLFDMAISREIERYEFIKQYIDQLGEIHLFKNNQSQYSRKYDAFLAGETPNVFDPEKEGGALMDLGVYNTTLAVMLFGKPDEVFYIPVIERGIDISGELILKYPKVICESSTSKNTASQNMILVQGEKGYLSIEKGYPEEKARLQLNHEEKETLSNTMSIEKLDRIVRCMDEGDTSLYAFEKETVLTVVDILEKARKCAGIVFPSDR